jgi:nicotinamidase-related amidase
MGRLIDDVDSVLVVIDTQPGFLRKLEEEHARRVEDRIRWLVRVARHLGVPVVVTEEEPDRNGPTSEAVRAALAEGQVRHAKPSFGLAAVPEIVADLERSGRRTAVLCGLETDVCVAQSALGLLDAGWRVVVVWDAVASPGEAHLQGIARAREAGADLVGTKGLAYEWLRTVDRARELDASLDGDEPTDIRL